MAVRALTAAERGFEDLGLLYRLSRLQEAGGTVDTASSRYGPIRGKRGCVAHAALDYEGCGAGHYGWSGAAHQGRICHGPRIVPSAGLVCERAMACYASIQGERCAADALPATAYVHEDLPRCVAALPAEVGRRFPATR